MKLDWKMVLAAGVVLIALVWFLWNRLGKLPSAAAGAAADALDATEKTLTDPNNRANRVATAVLQPVLGYSDFTGKPNTIGGGLEEATRKTGEWLKSLW